MISFMITHYNTEISVQELAKSCNLSPSRFMHLFKEHTGQSCSAYLQSLRISNSLSLLTSTQLSITEICLQVGYSDPLYFSRVFTKHTGISPKKYREEAARNFY